MINKVKPIPPPSNNANNTTKTISTKIFKNGCFVTIPPDMVEEWRNKGWKTDEDLRLEAEKKIEEAKELNKK